MTTATAEAAAGQAGLARYGSISRGRRRALFWSYFFLILFVIFFLTPPVYMLITSLKIERGDLGGDQPVVGVSSRPCRTTSNC